MFPGDMQLDALFEYHGVSWMVIEDMFAFERAIYQRCFPAQLPLSSRGSTGRSAFTSCKTSLPLLFSRFTVQISLFSTWTLAHVWSERRDNDIHIFDVLPLAAAVCIFIKMDPARAQVPRHTRPLADLPATIARLLARRQPHNAPSLHTGWTIQQILTVECHILEVLNYELTTPTPAAWIEVLERRHFLWQVQQLQQPYRPHIPRGPLSVLADSARLIAKAHIRDHPFTANSRASQVGASAWFISVAIWVCLALIGVRLRSHSSASPLLWLCATQHSSTVFVHFAPCSHWTCACHVLIGRIFQVVCTRTTYSICLQKSIECSLQKRKPVSVYRGQCSM